MTASFTVARQGIVIGRALARVARLSGRGVVTAGEKVLSLFLSAPSFYDFAKNSTGFIQMASANAQQLRCRGNVHYTKYMIRIYTESMSLRVAAFRNKATAAMMCTRTATDRHAVVIDVNRTFCTCGRSGLVRNPRRCDSRLQQLFRRYICRDVSVNPALHRNHNIAVIILW